MKIKKYLKPPPSNFHVLLRPKKNYPIFVVLSWQNFSHPGPVANEGLVWDSILKIEKNPGDDCMESWIGGDKISSSSPLWG